MSGDFSKLLTAVRDGEIRDTDRVREIIADARTAVEAKYEAHMEMQALLYEAQEAFLTGWAKREYTARVWQA